MCRGVCSRPDQMQLAVLSNWHADHCATSMHHTCQFVMKGKSSLWEFLNKLGFEPGAMPLLWTFLSINRSHGPSVKLAEDSPKSLVSPAATPLLSHGRSCFPKAATAVSPVPPALLKVKQWGLHLLPLNLGRPLGPPSLAEQGRSDIVGLPRLGQNPQMPWTGCMIPLGSTQI